MLDTLSLSLCVAIEVETSGREAIAGVSAPDHSQRLLHTCSTHTHTHSQKVQERWYESLHDWEAAYKAYQERQKQRPDDISLTLGKMRCLHAMGEW